MIEFTLLIGMLVFVIALHRWLKTSAEEQSRLNEEHRRKNLFVLLPVALGFLVSCNV
jgi:hypothetical protein